MENKGSYPKYVLMLGVMTALGAVSTDMYLPNLPDVATDLDTTETMAVLTMTFMMLGGALGQLIVGPLSDRFGRRAPALFGTALHVLTALGCAFAPSIVPLIGLRLAMGIFNASAAVTAMAVIRDRFVGAAAAGLMSRLMLIIGVAPLFAPTLGTYIGDWVGWRGVFVALALYGVGLFIVIFLKLPETLPAERRVTRNPLKGFADLLRDRYFIGLGVIPACISTALMSYVAGSPFVLQEGYQLSGGFYALIFAVNGLGLVAGAQLNAALVKRFTSSQILSRTMPVSVCLALWLAFVGWTGIGGLYLLWGSLFILIFTLNMNSPNAGALALARHGEKAGTASALVGFVQGVAPAAIGPLVTVFGGDARAMTSIMAAALLVGLVVLATVTPIYRRGGAAELDSAGL